MLRPATHLPSETHQNKVERAFWSLVVMHLNHELMETTFCCHGIMMVAICLLTVLVPLSHEAFFFLIIINLTVDCAQLTQRH